MLRWSSWLILLLVACGPTTPTTHISGSGSRDIEIRIENHNWNLAKVYIRPAYSGGLQRIGTVSPLYSDRVIWRASSPEFVLHVAFLAGRDIWESQVWYDSEYCLSLVIADALQHSYVVPCVG